jgi:ubiquinone/menaquinone biosynthesis C-methylase UbiE
MPQSLCYQALLFRSGYGSSECDRDGSGEEHWPRRNTEQVVESGLQWHPSLYAGSARYYATGRVGYPPALAKAVAVQLGLDGSGRLLDVGCGPGSLTLLLAPWFEQVTGVDADRDMLAEASRLAEQAGTGNVGWLHLRAEELPAGLGLYRVISFAQSFHWMDQLRVARTALAVLEDSGACLHVHATTHRGVETDAVLPHPKPPRSAIDELVKRYLGSVSRWGKGPPPDKANREEEVYRAAGFNGPQRIEVPGDIVERTSDQIVAGVFSLSSATPHLFGERRHAFEADLRRLLHDANPNGIFSEQMRDIAVDIWRATKG